MIIGVGGMSKLVHIVDTTSLGATSSSRRDQRAVHVQLPHESTQGVGPSAVAGAVASCAPGHLYHYSVYRHVHASGHDTLTAPPTDSSTSTSSMMEPIACTQSGYDGEGDGCITIATLHNVWRLVDIVTESIQEIRDDLFMIPIQESLTGQRSSSHELVIDNN